MKKIILIALAAVTITAQAQPVYVDRIGFKLESIADIDIGWMKTYKYPTPAKGKTLGNRIYSAKQIGYSQQFVEWMQQSYLPKGCLGDATYYQNYIPKFSGTNSLLGNKINEHKHALPLMYGAQTKIYMFLKKDAAGKFVPETSHGDYWHLEANQLEYISEPVTFVSSTEEYYFVLPDFKNHPKGYDADDKVRSNLLGFDNHKNIQEYTHFFLPDQSIRSQYVVIMTKGNKELPFEKITIGEFFTEAEKQFPVWQKIESLSAERYATAQKNLARLKEKYKSKWNEIAEVQLSKTQISLTAFVNATEGYDDFFDNKDIYGKEGIHTTFPILKVSKRSKELCKTDQPQWVVIRWTWGMQNEPYFIHFHESILNNFNFDYVYNYFFNPEKVKDQPYKPLRSPFFKDVVVVTEASEASKKSSADKNIYFFEDFSGTAIGKSPVNWNSSLINGEKAVIAEAPEAAGNWIVVKGHAIKSSNLKNPFPPNFELSFDVAVPKDFTWGAKGLVLLLAKEKPAGVTEAFISLKLRPGFGGADGQVTIETKFPAGYANESNWYPATGFSNNKKLNRVTVVLKKSGETLLVLIDKNTIAEYTKGIPNDPLFNTLSFDMSNSDGENDRYYVSNIKITKD